MFIIITMLFQIQFFSNVDYIDNKSIYFKKYLSEIHNINSLPKDHIYVIVDSQGCETCNHTDFKYLNEWINSYKNATIILIVQNNNTPDKIKTLIKHDQVILDFGDYKKRNITPLTDGFIRVKNSNITAIYEIEQYLHKSLLDKLIELTE